MTVVLNQAALAILLDSEEGPVGRFVEEKAFEVVVAARQNVRAYYESAPSLTVDQDVDLAMEGSTATVGIRDAGSKSRYLARRHSEGTLGWLSSALRR